MAVASRASAAAATASSGQSGMPQRQQHAGSARVASTGSATLLGVGKLAWVKPPEACGYYRAGKITAIDWTNESITVKTKFGEHTASMSSSAHADTPKLEEVLARGPPPVPPATIAELGLWSAKECKGPSGRVYMGTSLCCLSVHQQPRCAAIRTVEAAWFDPVILTTIVLNCATMAWESPLDRCCTRKADFIDVMEWIYLLIFTFELIAKVGAPTQLALCCCYCRNTKS